MSRRATRARPGERGTVLVALVLTLAGSALLWLAAGARVPLEERLEARDRLLAARRAVLAHVAAYPDVYGPRGAGPAHLPCPDIDTPLAVGAVGGGDLAPGPAAGRGTGRAFGGDGPDPPCGDGALAVGRLPRHVTLPTHREAFHHEPTQRLLYALSTAFVNNPVGRPVGPDVAADGRASDPARGDADDPVDGPRPANDPARGDAAEPFDRLGRADDPARGDADDLVDGRGRDGVRHGDDDATVAIIVDALDTDARSREWVRALYLSDRPTRHRSDASARLLETLARRATAGGAGHVTLHRATLLGAARRRVAVWFVDTATDAARARCTAASGDVTTGTDPSPERCPSWPLDDGGCDATGERGALAWLADETAMATAAADGCRRDGPAPSPSIENVPSERHWFVRNGWNRAVSVRADAACETSPVRCRLRDADGGGPGLAFVLEPAPGGAP